MIKNIDKKIKVLNLMYNLYTKIRHCWLLKRFRIGCIILKYKLWSYGLIERMSDDIVQKYWQEFRTGVLGRSSCQEFLSGLYYCEFLSVLYCREFFSGVLVRIILSIILVLISWQEFLSGLIFKEFLIGVLDRSSCQDYLSRIIFDECKYYVVRTIFIGLFCLDYLSGVLNNIIV